MGVPSTGSDLQRGWSEVRWWLRGTSSKGGAKGAPDTLLARMVSQGARRTLGGWLVRSPISGRGYTSHHSEAANPERNGRIRAAGRQHKLLFYKKHYGRGGPRLCRITTTQRVVRLKLSRGRPRGYKIETNPDGGCHHTVSDLEKAQRRAASGASLFRLIVPDRSPDLLCLSIARERVPDFPDDRKRPPHGPER